MKILELNTQINMKLPLLPSVEEVWRVLILLHPKPKQVSHNLSLAVQIAQPRDFVSSSVNKVLISVVP